MSFSRTALLTTISAALLISTACGDRDGNGEIADELSDEAMAEAMLTQVISGYHEASLTLSTDHIEEFSVECATQGSVDWSQYDDGGDICLTVDSSACSFSSAEAGSLEIETSLELCGNADLAIEDSDGVDTLIATQSLDLIGTVEVTRNSLTRDCDFELSIDAIEEADGNSSHYEVDVSGTLCDRDYSASVTIDLSASVSGSAELE